MPHERLLLKAKFYCFSGKLNNWLRVFPTGRRQRVVVNGSSFNWSTVLSGVSQGTVLGPILCLLFINDLPSVVLPNVKLFADDSVLYRRIKSSADHHTLLRKSLLRLEQEAAMCVQINFAPSSNTPSEGATFKKYLGVYITSPLNWSKQTVEVKKKANKILGVLQRNLASCSRTVKERAYLTLVRPVREYDSAHCLVSIYTGGHHLRRFRSMSRSALCFQRLSPNQ